MSIKSLSPIQVAVTPSASADLTNKSYIDTKAAAIEASLAPSWDESAHYVENDIVSYQGKIYIVQSSQVGAGVAPTSSAVWAESTVSGAVVSRIPVPQKLQVRTVFEQESSNASMIIPSVLATVIRCVAQGGDIDLYLSNYDTPTTGMLDVELWIPVVSTVSSFYFGFGGGDSAEVTWINGSLSSLTVGNTHIIRIRAFTNDKTTIYAELLGSFATPRNVIEVTTSSDATNHTGVSLRDALASAESGDLIRFSSSLGTAVINLVGGALTVPTGVEIDGGGRITLDGNTVDRIISTTGSIVLTGLTLQNGKKSGQGGAVYLNNGGSVLCTDCVFSSNNSTGFGGVFYSSSGGSITAIRCVFTGNNSIYGSICYGTGLTFNASRCLFQQNGGSTCKMMFHLSGTASLENCIIYNNTSGASTYDIFNIGGTTTMRNCTIYGNAGQAFNVVEASTLNIYNSVVVGNMKTSTISGTVSADHVLSDQSTLASSGLLTYNSGQPLFDSTTHYTPVAGSQVIGAGDNSFVTAAEDYNGDTRIVGSAVDLGAVEYQG